MSTKNVKYIGLNHNGIDYLLCSLDCKTIVEISYVARRGESEEQGAVQRILNKSRISSISDYVLNGGYFPTNIILNVIDTEKVNVKKDSFDIFISERIAQVLDGQHRVAGMRDALSKDPRVGDTMYPVLIAVGLTTEQCADIFVSINTEQKTVPKSLIYDLYGLTSTSSHDYSIERGRDIAFVLNSEDDSPYRGFIKFPGSTRFKGGIQLSSLVNALRPLVKTHGEFEKYQIQTLEFQAKVLKNYFKALEYYYDKKWYELSNPFLYASGFSASVDVLVSILLPFCYSKKSFSFDTFKSALNITKDTLLKQSDVKGKSGETAKLFLYDELKKLVNIDTITETDLEF